ncbi:MAG: hypothetical protein HKN87_23870 [Saprospiraceae bacterium]|nr:hypothetical protein [Saprospiraceae bacterium]
MKTTYLLCFVSLITFLSCKSVQSLIDSGDFDAALQRASRKAMGEKAIKKAYVVAIEEAFAKAMSRDLRHIERLKSTNRAKEYAEILQTFDRIRWRQDRLRALLPLRSKEGYLAKFSFTDTGEDAHQALQTYLGLTYNEALSMLQIGRQGYKESAQIAYAMFSKLWEYTSAFKDAKRLQAEAYALGHIEIGIAVKNQTNLHLSNHLVQTLLESASADRKWIRFHQMEAKPHAMDHYVTIELQQFDVGPEQWYERQSVDESEIEAGFEYELDKSGNVMKDSLGNDIKHQLWQRIAANVMEIHQRKASTLFAVMRCRDRDYVLIEETPIESSSVFEHFSTTYAGDPRALSRHSRKFLDNTPLAYPTAEELFEESILNLSLILKQKSEHSHYRSAVAMH